MDAYEMEEMWNELYRDWSDALYEAEMHDDATDREAIMQYYYAKGIYTALAYLAYEMERYDKLKKMGHRQLLQDLRFNSIWNSLRRR